LSVPHILAAASPDAAEWRTLHKHPQATQITVSVPYGIPLTPEYGFP
jgi:hypothetical protein